MTPFGNQRWLFGRDFYRPAGEVIDPRRYEVAAISEDRVAKAFVLSHHYSGSFPAARFRFGIYRGKLLVGVAVFSQPVRNEVLTGPFPMLEPAEAVELGRFVLLDSVPGNGETWFLARAFDLLRVQGLLGVVSFSDPQPRTCADGRVVFPGHIGTIYQAHNGRYLGRGTARTLRLLPDGTVFSARAASKVRQLERGWKYSAAILESHGAVPLDVGHEDPAAWLRRWTTTLTRPLRHPGNHRYVWGLNRRVTRHLADSQVFPKSLEAA